MEHPYRIHSSIGFGFLQLLMLSSLAYPTPPPPLYHNIALIRMMGTVYFTMFHDKPIYLKLECITILLEVIRDTLYIWYIIRDYTYIFGVFDVVGNLMFCTVIVLSFTNGEERWNHISDNFEGLRKTCVDCCWKNKQTSPSSEYLQNGGSSSRDLEERGIKHIISSSSGHMYSSLPTYEHNHHDTNHDETPVYTFGGRQAFKPSFYSSSWGNEYLKSKVEREFDRIDYRHNTNNGDIGMVTSADGNTQYIRFDELEPTSTTGVNHYANIFVSPYFTKDGTLITSFSEWTKRDTIGVCLFIYNLIQFIYQLMMYHSIIRSCREYHAGGEEELATNKSIANERLMRWLC
jgi:hypothetical protein